MVRVCASLTLIRIQQEDRSAPRTGTNERNATTHDPVPRTAAAAYLNVLRYGGGGVLDGERSELVDSLNYHRASGERITM